jgi:hypothetical protein
MADKKYLKIGDVILERLHGRLMRRITIARITDTLAVSGNVRFDKLVTNGFVRAFGGIGRLPYHYLKSTPELEKKWRLTVAIGKINNANFQTMSIQRIEAMAALCGE